LKSERDLQMEAVQTKVLAILPGLNILDTITVLMSLASNTSANILKMSREDFLEMCAEFYDKRHMEISELRRSIQ